MDGFLDDMPELFEGVKKKRRRPPPPKHAAQNSKSRIQNYPAVIYHVIKCPKCRSENTKVTTTKRPIRYHRCEGCGHNFKSVER